MKPGYVIELTKSEWINAIVKKLHPYSKTISVTDYWYSGGDEVCLCYNRRFDGYSSDYLDAESIAKILGYKKVTINKDNSITAYL